MMKELMGDNWFNQFKNTKIINFENFDSSIFEGIKL